MQARSFKRESTFKDGGLKIINFEEFGEIVLRPVFGHKGGVRECNILVFSFFGEAKIDKKKNEVNPCLSLKPIKNVTFFDLLG